MMTGFAVLFVLRDRKAIKSSEAAQWRYWCVAADFCMDGGVLPLSAEAVQVVKTDEISA